MHMGIRGQRIPTEKEKTMKEFTVYGSGCRNCDNTKNLIRQVAEHVGVPVEVKEVTDMAEIMAAGIMSTPGVALNGEIMHVGGVPTPEEVRAWLRG